MRLCCVYLFLLVANSESTNWNTLKQKVELRLFTPHNYNIMNELKTVSEAVWDLGLDLPCTVQDNLQTQVIPPPNFDASLPLKVVSHGFVGSTKADCTNFVNAWMDKTKRRTNIILIEWLDLSHHTTDKIPLIKSFLEDLRNDSAGLNTDVYKDAARNAIFVGRYVGHCVAALANLTADSKTPPVHLVGHSLGAHLIGNAGRTFAKASGRKVDRVTALDPAGPGFVEGPLVELVEDLHVNMLNKNDAEFVDVIHTHSSLFGYLNPLGHADFYPDGGKYQENCEDLLPISRIICSHERSFHYYVNSIMEPRLFPSYECKDLNLCTHVRHLFNSLTYRLRSPDSYMGESAIKFKTEGSKMYFLKLNRNEFWNYYEHKRTSVFHKVLKGTANLIYSALHASGLFSSENRNHNLGYGDNTLFLANKHTNINLT